MIDTRSCIVSLQGFLVRVFKTNLKLIDGRTDFYPMISLIGTILINTTLPQLMAHLLSLFMCFFHFKHPFFWWVGIEAFTTSIQHPFWPSFFNPGFWIFPFLFSAFHWHCYNPCPINSQMIIGLDMSISPWYFYDFWDSVNYWTRLEAAKVSASPGS